jgi:hypothetical protein
MEDTFFALAILIIVGTVAAHSFIWTWLRARKQGVFRLEERRFVELEQRIAELARENNALAIEVERLGEMSRALTRDGRVESQQLNAP